MIGIFRFTRGETVSIALEAVEGDVTGAVCEADLKLSVNGLPPPSEVLPVATFTVSPVAEVTPGGNPGWILTLGANGTEALPPGRYVTDARLALPSGFVEQTEPILIELRERVTA